MKNKLLLRLQAHDKKVLAQALLELASRSDEAKTVVHRLTRTANEAHISVQREIKALHNLTRSIEWHEMPKFIRKLEIIVEDIATVETTPEQRFDLICRFIETDEIIVDYYEESSGYVVDFFQTTALSVFRECTIGVASSQKRLVVRELEHLLSSNDFSVRDCLLGAVIANLDDETNRMLISRFSARSDQVTDIEAARPWLSYIMQIASHLKDTKLFELSALEMVADLNKVPVYTYFDIALNYFNAADYDQAKFWMDKTSDEVGYAVAKYNKFWVSLYEKLGDHTAGEQVARKEFDRDPSAAALEVLLKTIGEQHRVAVVESQRKLILANPEYSHNRLSFLIDTDLMLAASEYAVQHRNSIDGHNYWHLPRQSDRLLACGYPVAAVCIYRVLLDSILNRGQTKAYYYGVKYLSKLDELSDTQLAEGMLDHESYKRRVIQLHGKKHSFWRMYDAACVG